MHSSKTVETDEHINQVMILSLDNKPICIFAMTIYMEVGAQILMIHVVFQGKYDWTAGLRRLIPQVK